MIVTEADLRDQLRRPTSGARVVVPVGARLSPSAADFVKHWKLQLVEDGGVLAYASPDAKAASGGSAAWDTASAFPVVELGQVPTCTCCGMSVDAKPDALTQLNACHYAVKNHPRIRFRGRIDSLHAYVLLTQVKAVASGSDDLAKDLGTVAAYCREIMSAEYNERPVADVALQGWDEAALHQATHDPLGVLGVPHLTISANDPELQHWLNVCRTQAREIESTALDAFPSPHHPYGASICHAMNRLSSVFYFLQLRLAQGGAP